MRTRREQTQPDQDVDHPARLMAQQPDHAAMHGAPRAARGSDLVHIQLLGPAQQVLQRRGQIFHATVRR